MTAPDEPGQLEIFKYGLSGRRSKRGFKKSTSEIEERRQRGQGKLRMILLQCAKGSIDFGEIESGTSFVLDRTYVVFILFGIA